MCKPNPEDSSGGRMKVAIIGAGHVGLVAALGLAELGHQVICSDRDATKIKALAEGCIPIHEPFLPELLGRHRERRIRFITSALQAASDASIIFIAVPTPTAADGKTELSFIDAVIAEIAPAITDYKVIVEKSTVPIGTNQHIHEMLLELGVPECAFDVVSNPEFLREGSAITDFLYPDRIVIGAGSSRASEAMRDLYLPLLDGSYRDGECSVPPRVQDLPAPKWLMTSANTAELIKQASNAFLAMKVSYINAVAKLCEAAGADVDDVCEGIGSDRRIGAAYLQPGLGFGGSCLPKDLASFQSVAEAHGAPILLLEEIQQINREQRERFLQMVHRAVGHLEGKRIAALGLAYKRDTEDVRESPAVEVIRILAKERCEIRAYDPAARWKDGALPNNVFPAGDAYSAARSADALLILTDWKEFAELDLGRLRDIMRQPLVIDGRNLFRPEVM